MSALQIDLSNKYKIVYADLILFNFTVIQSFVLCCTLFGALTSNSVCEFEAFELFFVALYACTNEEM
ncbi:hypothetical protein DPMN_043454 [Dreissena polymorpha]|uniref:Uncharacterized protein n=1 Tax=Dreissena polymorpha TaxID=45954 RepID=A0A9D4D2U6_DREPO|nr:hypothetical protein DPMN_043454 [Dreissena polymorpha]